MFKFNNHRQTFWFAVAQAKKKTFYQILELPSNAPAATIKKNYYKLAKIYHPDVYKGKDKTRFQKIHDQAKRRIYDQEIGVRMQPSGEQKHQSINKEDYGKPKNPMDYQTKTEQINIDEEYEKFFSQKPKTQFQQIQMHEAVQFRNMSEKQRVRRHVKDMYDANADIHRYKTTFQKSFNTILNDQIDQKNQMFQDGLEAAKKEEENQKPEVQKKKKRYLYILFVIGSIASLSVLNSALTKHKLVKEQKETVQKWWQQAQKQADEIEVRQRFQF